MIEKNEDLLKWKEEECRKLSHVHPLNTNLPCIEHVSFIDFDQRDMLAANRSREACEFAYLIADLLRARRDAPSAACRGEDPRQKLIRIKSTTGSSCLRTVVTLARRVSSSSSGSTTRQIPLAPARRDATSKYTPACAFQVQRTRAITAARHDVFPYYVKYTAH